MKKIVILLLFLFLIFGCLQPEVKSKSKSSSVPKTVDDLPDEVVFADYVMKKSDDLSDFYSLKKKYPYKKFYELDGTDYDYFIHSSLLDEIEEDEVEAFALKVPSEDEIKRIGYDTREDSMFIVLEMFATDFLINEKLDLVEIVVNDFNGTEEEALNYILAGLYTTYFDKAEYSISLKEKKYYLNREKLFEYFSSEDDDIYNYLSE